jgi:hypothetical protein
LIYPDLYASTESELGFNNDCIVTELLLENILKRVTRYVILRIQKRESQKDTAYPRILSFNLLQGQPSTIRGSWRLFSFVLENLITQTNKGNQQYTKLD